MIDEIINNYKKTPVTIITIALCVVIYIVSFILYGVEMNSQQALMFGGYNPLFVHFNHDYYRIITANFIHFGILHLVMNCYSLYGIGCFIERVLKTKKYIWVLFVSAIATNLLPYCLFLINGFEANVVSGGISGVIFGLIGALGALALRFKDIFMKLFNSLLPNVIVLLAISFIVPSVSLSGHVSGLIGGFLATLLVLYLPLNKKKSNDDLLN